MRGTAVSFGWIVIAALGAVGFPTWVSHAEQPSVQRDATASDSAIVYSPYANSSDPDRQLYWGDTHVHTAVSMDAGAYGNRLGLADAYRFALGEQVTASLGQPIRLSRPLDFLIIADHSDNMGFFADLIAGKEHIMADPTGRDWSERIRAGDGARVGNEMVGLFAQGKMPPALVYSPDSQAFRSAWQESVETAERFNAPGKFTAFIGYEWTSLVKGKNLHRVVVYRDGGDKGGQMMPFTNLPPAGSSNPRDLWKWMDEYEKKTQGRVLAIPHNGNLSNGIMFPLAAQYDGRKLDRDYVQTRAAREPLYEVTQFKGDGEAHPVLSPDDEFADFENWDQSNLDFSEAKTDAMLAGEYAREALKRGLVLEQGLGTNPYAFGMIGSTDTHTSLSAVEENNYLGDNSGLEPNATRATLSAPMPTGILRGSQLSASGLAGVWARDNTREALFDAMERKEVFATTGPRIGVRFFGGWAFEAGDAQRPDPSRVGYRKGVPMGGVLPKRPKPAGAPTFLVMASRDPIGANLDRIQIVKGWVDDAGESFEQIYHVAASDGRKPDRKGKLPPVGTTVDVAHAEWTNTIGTAELASTWTDPDFVEGQRAFYYARVIEIPTPRWTTYDAVRFGVERTPHAPATIQERAYTSPIWYQP